MTKSAVQRFAGAFALFTLLTAVMTWPQAANFATHALEHQDVYFNMWRFGWVAHALSSSAALFDGNVFYPEARALTFSDATFIEALIAAPLLWSGMRPVLVHNIVILGGLVLCASGAWVLARHLTGSTAAAIVAGIVFAYAPYRFDHYMHMELQWAVWVPWAFWALDRAIETGKRRYGIMTGVCIALQFMSSIYYGVFLATLIGLTAPLLLLTRRAWRRPAASLAIGAALGAAMCVPYALPYLETREEMGVRAEGEIATFSARPSDYLKATPENYLYGELSARRRSQSERRLFPGALAALLALTALLVSRPSTTVIVYVLAGAAAFEMSLGVRGYSYPFLNAYVPLFQSLRSPARLGIFVLFFVAILAAHGYAAIERSIWPRLRVALAVGVCAVLMLEYWVAPLRLVAYPNEPPPLYAWLARQPRGIVAEFPVPSMSALPGDDPRYAYMSTFHWMPMINGYSGYYPASYVNRMEQLFEFPTAQATRTLRLAGVRYVIIHERAYPFNGAQPIIAALQNDPAYAQAGTFEGDRGAATVFRLR